MIKILDGWARKVALGAILASVIGWLIFVICFGSFNNGDNFYNDVRENEQVTIADGSEVPLRRHPDFGLKTDQIIEEDFPKNRADSDFFTFYFFVVVHPLAVILVVAHLILHGLPVVRFILSLAAHLLLTLDLVCGAGVFWAEGNRLFSNDNNYRNEYGSAVVPDDWLTNSYWASWLVGEWVGIFLTGICVIVYFTVTPFFTNSGGVFSLRMEARNSYEMEDTNKVPL